MSFGDETNNFVIILLRVKVTHLSGPLCESRDRQFGVKIVKKPVVTGLTSSRVVNNGFFCQTFDPLLCQRHPEQCSIILPKKILVFVLSDILWTFDLLNLFRSKSTNELGALRTDLSGLTINC